MRRRCGPHMAAPSIADAVAKLPNWLSAPPELQELRQVVPG
jgi:hypothetical protein